jgi:hypothetical protein
MPIVNDFLRSGTIIAGSDPNALGSHLAAAAKLGIDGF